MLLVSLVVRTETVVTPWKYGYYEQINEDYEKRLWTYKKLLKENGVWPKSQRPS